MMNARGGLQAPTLTAPSPHTRSTRRGVRLEELFLWVRARPPVPLPNVPLPNIANGNGLQSLLAGLPSGCPGYE